MLTQYLQTQLQILTAVVKLFLKKPSNNQGLVQKVLQQATADNDNPDIRDRAYVYWRLLSGDLDVAKVCLRSCALTYLWSRWLTFLVEHHSLPETRNLHNHLQPPKRPVRAAPQRAVHPRLRLPQAARVVRRQGSLRRRRDPARRHPGTAPRGRRQPHRRLSRSGRSQRCRRRATAEQRREPPGHRLRRRRARVPGAGQRGSHAGQGCEPRCRWRGRGCVIRRHG